MKLLMIVLPTNRPVSVRLYRVDDSILAIDVEYKNGLHDIYQATDSSCNLVHIKPKQKRGLNESNVTR